MRNAYRLPYESPHDYIARRMRRFLLRHWNFDRRFLVQNLRKYAHLIRPDVLRHDPVEIAEWLAGLSETERREAVAAMLRPDHETRTRIQYRGQGNNRHRGERHGAGLLHLEETLAGGRRKNPEFVLDPEPIPKNSTVHLWQWETLLRVWNPRLHERQRADTPVYLGQMEPSGFVICAGPLKAALIEMIRIGKRTGTAGTWRDVAKALDVTQTNAERIVEDLRTLVWNPPQSDLATARKALADFELSHLKNEAFRLTRLLLPYVSENQKKKAFRIVRDQIQEPAANEWLRLVRSPSRPFPEPDKSARSLDEFLRLIRDVPEQARPKVTNRVQRLARLLAEVDRNRKVGVPSVSYRRTTSTVEILAIRNPEVVVSSLPLAEADWLESTPAKPYRPPLSYAETGRRVGKSGEAVRRWWNNKLDLDPATVKAIFDLWTQAEATREHEEPQKSRREEARESGSDRADRRSRPSVRPRRRGSLEDQSSRVQQVRLSGDASGGASGAIAADRTEETRIPPARRK